MRMRRFGSSVLEEKVPGDSERMSLKGFPWWPKVNLTDEKSTRASYGLVNVTQGISLVTKRRMKSQLKVT